jgi:hypothetical protein
MKRDRSEDGKDRDGKRKKLEQDAENELANKDDERVETLRDLDGATGSRLSLRLCLHKHQGMHSNHELEIPALIKHRSD